MTEQLDKTVKRRTCTVPEAAKQLGISNGAAYEAARRGDLPVIRIGQRILVPTAALDRMLDRKLEEVA
jgi:excisionase family DNA binding protein